MEENKVSQKVYVVTIYDESAVVLEGDQVYNDGLNWTSEKIAEAIALQLGRKVEVIDATKIAEKNRDFWTWPGVIQEALADVK